MLKCGNFEAFPKKYSKKGDGARFGTEGAQVQYCTVLYIPSKKHVRRRERTSRGRSWAEKRASSSREVLLGDGKVHLGTRIKMHRKIERLFRNDLDMKPEAT